MAAIQENEQEPHSSCEGHSGPEAQLLPLSPKTAEHLNAHGYATVKDLQSASTVELMLLPGITLPMVEEIVKIVTPKVGTGQTRTAVHDQDQRHDSSAADLPSQVSISSTQAFYLPLEAFGLPLKILRVLRQFYVYTAGQLSGMSRTELVMTLMFKKKSVQQIETALAKYALGLRTNHEAGAPLPPRSPKHWYNWSLSELRLQVPILTRLVFAEITTIGKLITTNVDELRKMANLDKKMHRYVHDKIISFIAASIDRIVASAMVTDESDSKGVIETPTLLLTPVETDDHIMTPQPVIETSPARQESLTRGNMSVAPDETSEWDDWHISTMPLQRRSYNALYRAGVQTVGQLRKMTDEQLLRISNLGVTSLADIRQCLELLMSQGVQPLSQETYGTETRPTLGADLLDMPVSALGLSTRPANVLHRANIVSLEALCRYTDQELLDLPGMGKGSLREIRGALGRLGVALSNQSQYSLNGPAPGPDLPSLAHWLDLWWSGLSIRQQFILAMRAGLDGNGPRTLEAIGDELEVTRERVRQLERRGQKELQRLDRLFSLTNLMTLYTELISELGGIASVQDLIAPLEARYSKGGIDSEAFIRLTLPLNKSLQCWEDEIWALESFDRRLFELIRIRLNETLNEFGTPIRKQELLAELGRRDSFLVERQYRLVEACLRYSSDFLTTPDGWVLLRGWSSRGSTGIWILAALHSLGRPSHFTEVQAQVNRLWPDTQLSDNNVHAALSRLQEVERTDLGIFALKRWNVGSDRTITDLLEEAFTAEGPRVTLERLVAYVQSRKNCKEGSIRAALELDPRFMRLATNTYVSTAQVAPSKEVREHLSYLLTIPLYPQLILGIIGCLSRNGNVTKQQIHDYLSEHRQEGRVDDYCNFLLAYGWADQDGEEDFYPTILSLDLLTVPNYEARLIRFALSNPNFQTYLNLHLTEFLIKQTFKGRNAFFDGTFTATAPQLRPIYETMLSKLTDADRAFNKGERLVTVRAPGIPQVFLRWAEPVFGYNASPPGKFLRRLVENPDIFPFRPSFLLLELISDESLRTLVLTLALAGEVGALLNFHQFRRIHDSPDQPMSDLYTAARSLLFYGLIVDDRDPMQVRLLSPVNVIVRSELADLHETRNALLRAGVLDKSESTPQTSTRPSISVLHYP